MELTVAGADLGNKRAVKLSKKIISILDKYADKEEHLDWRGAPFYSGCKRIIYSRNDIWVATNKCNGFTFNYLNGISQFRDIPKVYRKLKALYKELSKELGAFR